ncbi:MAG: hypothetical protein ACREIU_00575 [Planctomycetota bacterium]
MMFFRTKDLADVEAIVRNRAPSFDAAYVRGWLARIFGERDPRVVRWDETWPSAAGGSASPPPETSR